MKKVYIEPEASVVEIGKFLQGDEVIHESAPTDDFTNKNSSFESEEEENSGSGIWDTSMGE